MRDTIKIENNEVTILKDCQVCTKLPVCKFHSQMHKLCNSNEFYGMQQYLEWNNSLEAFEKHASCQFYQPNLTTNEDGSFINVHNKIRNFIVNDYIKDNALKNVSYSEKDLNHTIDGEKKVVEITDIIKQYKLKK